jgi:hypothetical protein
MKSLLLITALLFNVAAFSNELSDEIKSNKLQAAKTELKSLFDASKPSTKGTVVAIIEFNAEGNGSIKEINSSDESLRLLVEKKIESKSFRNIKNETIRLAVDFRK